MENEPRLVESFIASGKVRLVYRHLLQLGDGSMITAEASECAGDQGKFWQMHAMLYSRQSEVYTNIDAALARFAADLKLDEAAFGQCMQSHTHQAAIQADYDSATAAGVRSRPVFDIAGERLIGFQPWETFRRTVEGKLP